MYAELDANSRRDSRCFRGYRLSLRREVRMVVDGPSKE
jgi:hypothetical protein